MDASELTTIDDIIKNCGLGAGGLAVIIGVAKLLKAWFSTWLAGQNGTTSTYSNLVAENQRLSDQLSKTMAGLFQLQKAYSELLEENAKLKAAAPIPWTQPSAPGSKLQGPSSESSG